MPTCSSACLSLASISKDMPSATCAARHGTAQHSSSSSGSEVGCSSTGYRNHVQQHDTAAGCSSKERTVRTHYVIPLPLGMGVRGYSWLSPVLVSSPSHHHHHHRRHLTAFLSAHRWLLPPPLPPQIRHTHTQPPPPSHTHTHKSKLTHLDSVLQCS